MISFVRYFGLLLGALLANSALADEPFVVRADESPTDSLISIDIGAAPFMLEQIGPRQIDLVTPDLTRAFDLSAMLSTGASRRVATARVVSDEHMNRLRFTLACDCAYGYAISDGVLQLTFRAPEPEAAALAVPKVRGVSKFAPSRSPRPFPRPSIPNQTAAASDPAAVAPASTTTDDDVLLARKHLLEQLSRAADQGLLEFVSDDAAAAAPLPPTDQSDAPIRPPEKAPPSGPAPKTLVEVTDAETDVALAGPLRPPAPREAPLRARTAIDKVFRADRSETRTAVAPCIATSDLDLASWSDTDDFSNQVAAYRQNLVDDFDQPRPDVVEALAQMYVLNGFGVEAERLLRTFGESVPNRSVLIELARIVDGRALFADGPIAKSSPCNGAALLWRRAADLPRATEPPSPEVWADMAEAFTSLPRRIRGLIAAPLLSSLVDGGEVEHAERLNLILSRAPVRNAPALDLAQARLLAAGGEAVAAEGLYQRLAERDAPEAREGLIRLLDSRLSRGAPISPALADALSELAFTTRGQPLELIAKTAEIRAHAAIDGPAAALGMVRDAIERTPYNATVLKDAGHAALERLSPGEGAEAAMSYVSAVMAYEPLISTTKDGDAARLHVAREMISLGLANAALTFLAPARARAGEDVRLTSAEALLSLDRIEEGLAEIGETEGAKANALRATALSLRGDFAAAAGADPSDASRALSAGDWQTAASGRGARALLAQYMVKSPEDIERPDKNVKTPVSLSGARAAQDAARATRALIDEALSDG